ATRELLWRFIKRYADLPDEGRRLFSGTLAQRNALWREFRNYVRQAEEYDSAAAGVSGTSGGLLYYYANLQLAKAELLTVAPNRILGARIHHGLTFNPQIARSIDTDVVTVANGVFPMLYEKRTGLAVTPGTGLSVRRLLQSVPEIGWEI